MHFSNYYLPNSFFDFFQSCIEETGTSGIGPTPGPTQSSKEESKKKLRKRKEKNATKSNTDGGKK